MARKPVGHCEIGAVPRLAHGVEEEIRQATLKRLRRIEGQVRGLQTMVEQGRYCAEILMQVASAERALGGVARLQLKNHLRQCVTHAVVSGPQAAREEKFAEILHLFETRWK